MPVISHIKKQAKRARYSVFVDDKYSFSCSELGLATIGIAVGDELSNRELDRLIGEAEFDRFYDRVLSYLALRPRSRLEIERYLKRKDCPAEIVINIVERLADQKLIDDSDFGQRWAESRRLNRPRSKRHLVYELKQKGLTEDEIETATADLDDAETLRQILLSRNLIQKYPDQQKLMAYLARQGFSYDVIKAGLKDLED